MELTFRIECAHASLICADSISSRSISLLPTLNKRARGFSVCYLPNRAHHEPLAQASASYAAHPDAAVGARTFAGNLTLFGVVNAISAPGAQPQVCQICHRAIPFIQNATSFHRVKTHRSRRKGGSDRLSPVIPVATDESRVLAHPLPIATRAVKRPPQRAQN